ncbi:ABC transporter G family member 15 [Forsythia ovata]|uniref:ABC transporter G family member 15 n=1 Tax=Forsythia ovata TaxID=205694 RepID=A0ABD1U9M4_9LAMI
MGGFFRLPNDLPGPVWKYPVYYISFHKYANEGFYKNEFQGLVFPNLQVGGPTKITGDEVLRKYWQMDTSFSKWSDLAIVFGMVIGYRVLAFGIIKGIEKLYPIIRNFLARAAEKRTDCVEE